MDEKDLDKKEMGEREILAERFEANRGHLRVGGVSDAWLAGRRGRRRSGSMASPGAHRCGRGRKSQGLADDSGRARVPRHAARPQDTARRADRQCGSDRRRRQRRAGPADRRTRSASRCWWCWRHCRRRRESPSSCTMYSMCRSTTSRRSSAARRRRRGSLQGARASVCRARRRTRRPIANGSAKSSAHSSPHPRAATFPPCSPSLIPAWCCAPTHRRLRQASPASATPRPSRRKSAVSRKWRRSSAAAHALRAPALVDGDAGLAIAFGGQTRMVFDFVVENGRITEISLIADPQSVAALDVEL